MKSCDMQLEPLFTIDLLACMFCFPISDHVMLLEGIVSFKCRLMHVQIYA